MSRKIITIVLFLLIISVAGHAQDFSIGLRFSPRIIEIETPYWKNQSSSRYGGFLQWKFNRSGFTLGIDFINQEYINDRSHDFQNEGGSVYIYYQYYFIERQNWYGFGKMGIDFSSLSSYYDVLEKQQKNSIIAISPFLGFEIVYRWRFLAIGTGLDAMLFNQLNSIYKPVNFIPYFALKLNFK